MLRDRIAEKANNLKSTLRPCLGYIIVGELPQSELYVRLKLKACEEVGIEHHGFKLPATTSELALAEKVKELQNDSNINGILV